jgi:hypothetical protein
MRFFSLKEETMKLKVLMVAVVLAILFFITGIASAANGDLIVNGNLGDGSSKPEGKAGAKGVRISDTIHGVGTTSPGEKTEISGKMGVDGDPGVGTTTPAEKSEKNGN